MLIINADDLGRNQVATDRILECHALGVVTSASAMVFMADSERAAGLAGASGLDTGLHLNLTERFDQAGVPLDVRESQERVLRCLNAHHYASLCYWPWLRGHFRRAVDAQVREYQRLYGSLPAHFDGHHHMHLCANVLLEGLILRGRKVRRHFTFEPGEKHWLNRAYRGAVNGWIGRRYRTTDYLFSLPFCRKRGTLRRVLALATAANVELETHPEQDEDYHWLMGEGAQTLRPVPKTTYSALAVGGPE